MTLESQLNEWVARAKVSDISRNSECIEWWGSKYPNGYGQIYLGSLDKKAYAHRVSYEAFFGSIPSPLEIDHLCRNRKCVNIDHLEAVTHKVNCLRGNGIGAKNARKDRCHRGHKYGSRRDSRGYRECPICAKASYKNMYAKHGHKKRAKMRAKAAQAKSTDQQRGGEK